MFADKMSCPAANFEKCSDDLSIGGGDNRLPEGYRGRTRFDADVAYLQKRLGAAFR